MLVRQLRRATRPPADPQSSTAFLAQLTPVDGAWGSGRLLAGTAFSVVLTDDGRIAVGAVEPEKLYEALAVSLKLAADDARGG